MAHQRLGDAHVDVIHRHVVAVIGRPSQSQLRQVARAKHEAIHLIGEIHQYLGALTRLAVLIGHVVVLGVMTDIFEVLHHSSRNADFMKRHAERLDHLTGIGIGAVGRAETRHRDGMDVLAVTAHAVKRTHSHQQCKSRVQSARHAHDNRGNAREVQPAHETSRLDGDDFLTARVQAVILGGDKGQTAHRAQQFHFLVIQRGSH